MPSPRTTVAASLALIALAAATPPALSSLGSTTVSGLSGRWAGAGSYTPARGEARPFKCVATYFTDGEASRLKQNLRCQSDSYKLDASTFLAFDGRVVTGRWEDKIHALNGSVRGKLTPDGFDIDLEGRFFRARMVVVSDGCSQSVTVTPERADYVRELSAQMRKC